MPNKIIQITEENLRKAVESGDLKQLAPEVFEKKKVRVQINIKKWIEESFCVYPVSNNILEDTNGVIDSWCNMVNKPPMLMTLEWEE